MNATQTRAKQCRDCTRRASHGWHHPKPLPNGKNGRCVLCHARAVLGIATFKRLAKKYCRWCKTVKAGTAFGRSSSTRDGLDTRCKACRKQHRKEVEE